ncbi:MAG: hypothetical protein IJB27_03915 [Clostridia bacterium]|nr:hypothetical protein [Clostridia bacterium]
MKLVSFGEVLFDVYPDAAHIGGAPLNVAAHTALHGATVQMLSAVGDDALGQRALEQMRVWGIGTDLVTVHTDLPTGACNVTLDANGIPSYALAENTAWDRIEAPAAPLNADVLYFGTLALRSEANRNTLSRVLAENTFAEVVADVNIRRPFFNETTILFALKNATILKLSDEDWEQMRAFVPSVTAEEPEAICRALASLFDNLRVILWTQGGDGACAWEAATATWIHQPAVKATVVSTVGAGDSFASSFLARRQEGASIAACLKHAATVAALVVSNESAVPAYDPNVLSV